MSKELKFMLYFGAATAIGIWAFFIGYLCGYFA